MNCRTGQSPLLKTKPISLAWDDVCAWIVDMDEASDKLKSQESRMESAELGWKESVELLTKATQRITALEHRLQVIFKAHPDIQSLYGKDIGFALPEKQEPEPDADQP